MLHSRPLVSPVGRGLYLAVGNTFDLRLLNLDSPSLAGSLFAAFELPDLLESTELDIEPDDVQVSIDGSSHSSGRTSRLPGHGLASLTYRFTVDGEVQLDWLSIILDIRRVLAIARTRGSSDFTPVPWSEWGPQCCRVVTGFRVAVWGHRVVVAVERAEDAGASDSCAEWRVLDFGNQHGWVDLWDARFMPVVASEARKRGRRFLSGHDPWAAHYFSGDGDSLPFGPREIFPGWGPSALPCMEYRTFGPACTDAGFYVDERRLVILRVRLAFL